MDSPRQPTPYSRNVLWFGIVLIALIVVGGAAYWWFISRSGKDETANTNQNAVANTSSLNNSFTNQAAVTNTNTTNSITNTSTNTNAAPIHSEQKTFTYQRYDHGFSISLPANWKEGTPMMGTEVGSLVSFSAPDAAYQSVNVGYQLLGSDTLTSWVAKKRSELMNGQPGMTLTTNTELSNGVVYFQSLTPINTDYPDSPQYLGWHGYIVQNDRIYDLSISGAKDEIKGLESVLRAAMASFTFVNAKPYVEISHPAQKSSVSPAGSVLHIEWLDQPEMLNLIERKDLAHEQAWLFYNRQYYKVGSITSAPYKGKDLVLIFNTPEGPSFKNDLYRVVYDSAEKTFVYLEKHSDDLQSVYFPFEYDTKASITELDYPSEIAIPNSKITLQAETFVPNRLYSSYVSLANMFSDPTAGQVFFDPKLKCYLIRQTDGTVVQYHYKLNFISRYQGQTYASDAVKMVPNVTWSAGGSNTDEYTYNEPAGCGSTVCHALYSLEEIGGLSALTAIGQTSTGEPIYEYVNHDRQELRDIYKLYYVPEPEKKPAFEVFANDHPIFFWQDPFGKWLRFKKFEYIPAVECGKPVIYLYPETESQIRVRVAPTGGFTVTEPAYPAGGWAVTAQPDGRLTNSDGAHYSYLYWEGLGLNYEIPKEGFVVSQSEIPKFLNEKLSQLGLNTKESADFMEYWVPKFAGAPYYFVTFVDQTDFEQVAPLHVEPKPNTVIRVFMDYQPLEERIKVVPQRIETPSRAGFTVVEWGGALHR